MNEKINKKTVDAIELGLDVINRNNEIDVTEPTEQEKEIIRTTISYDDSEKISFYDFVNHLFDELAVLPLYREKLYKIISESFPENFNEEKISEFIKLTIAMWDGD